MHPIKITGGICKSSRFSKNDDLGVVDTRIDAVEDIGEDYGGN